ncbi:MAG TPA: hypothetical protein VF035_03890, partial [Longimicrobiales bacterium]
MMTRQTQRSIAFLPVSRLHIPHNNREVYLSRELTSRGWQVHWLRPASGTNEGVPVQWPELRYPDLDIRGRTYLLPAYLALRLRAAGISTVWISGWTLRSIPELTWMVSILKRAGLRVVFDPIDPICEFLAAMREGEEGDEAEDRVCIDRMRSVYQQCD